MAKELLMGNQALALGAIAAGVGLVSGYPGTPSTEILETVAKRNPGDVYVEWSVNEKSALEVAAGGAYAGLRTMVTMKQVGLNVASDPLMSLAYIGVKGGMVIVVADDPGPISSQTEQDTRQFAEFCKLPVFDPASPEDCYRMIGEAFDYSEKYHTPVLFRSSTRVCHGCASIELDIPRKKIEAEGFVKDPKWVIFPRLTHQNHLAIEARQPVLGDDFSGYHGNEVMGSGKKAVVTGGICYAYAREAMAFLEGVEEVLVMEELSPMLENALLRLKGKHGLAVKILGKGTGHSPQAGENSVELAASMLADFLGLKYSKPQAGETPPLAVRPPVLCAGCPHRASFYAVKKAMSGKKACFSGDIGCYTLGNAQPLDMVDTCLCMGAGVTIAQGLHRAEPDTVNFAFIGDSTFFHTGIPGVVNAVYNQTDIVICILDNSTTAMTGHQPHPGLGTTMMGGISQKISIYEVVKALGVSSVRRVNPFDLQAAQTAVRKAAQEAGVKVILFEAPCIAITKPAERFRVDEAKCIGCKKCIRELGCPAITVKDGKVVIEESLCYGCSICAQVCPVGAIVKGGEA